MDDETLRTTTELARRVTLLEADAIATGRQLSETRSDVAAIRLTVERIKKVQDDEIQKRQEDQQDTRRALRNLGYTIAGTVVGGGLLAFLVAAVSG